MILGFFSELRKYFRVIGYAATGRMSKAREAWNTNPDVIRATMDEGIGKAKKRIDGMLDAVSEILTIQEGKKAELSRQQEKLILKRKILGAAKLKITMRIKALQAQGVTGDAIKADPEFMSLNATNAKVTSEVADVENTVKQLTNDIAGLQTKVDASRVQLVSMKREVDRKKEKKATLVARAISAEQEVRLNQMLSGLSTNDDSAESEAEVENAVAKMEAKAKLTGMMAGTDTAVQDAELLAFAEQHATTSEFDDLIYASQEVEDKNAGKTSTDTSTDTDTLI